MAVHMPRRGASGGTRPARPWGSDASLQDWGTGTAVGAASAAGPCSDSPADLDSAIPAVSWPAASAFPGHRPLPSKWKGPLAGVPGRRRPFPRGGRYPGEPCLRVTKHALGLPALAGPLGTTYKLPSRLSPPWVQDSSGTARSWWATWPWSCCLDHPPGPRPAWHPCGTPSHRV